MGRVSKDLRSRRLAVKQAAAGRVAVRKAQASQPSTQSEIEGIHADLEDILRRISGLDLFANSQDDV